jgi:type I restriction enzyme M protein
LRLHSQFSRKAIESLRFVSGDEDIRSAIYDELGEDLFENPYKVRKQLEKLVDNWGKSDEEDEEGSTPAVKKALPATKKKKLLDLETWKHDARLMDVASQLRKAIGDGLFENHNTFRELVAATLDELIIGRSATDYKAILNAVSWRVEGAPEVIKKIHKPGKGNNAFIPAADPLRGLFETEIDGTTCIVEYEPDPELRDYEQISFLEAPASGQLEGLPTEKTTKQGIETFIRREVLPYTPDAWIVEGDTKIGYEISFTRHFYKPPQLRTLDQIAADIRKLDEATEAQLSEIIGKAK